MSLNQQYQQHRFNVAESEELSDEVRQFENIQIGDRAFFHQEFDISLVDHTIQESLLGKFDVRILWVLEHTRLSIIRLTFRYAG